MLIVPLRPVPNQSLQVILANQSCVIDVNQTTYGLFVGLAVGGQPIINGVIALNENRIVRSLYLGFQGDLAFQDLEGSSDPIYWGLGGRFILNYIEASELPEGIG